VLALLSPQRERLVGCRRLFRRHGWLTANA
jgi:hypothetical protein